jgi:hypothetical protein
MCIISGKSLMVMFIASSRSYVPCLKQERKHPTRTVPS